MTINLGNNSRMIKFTEEINIGDYIYERSSCRDNKEK
ncbi:hypothetical protein SPSIL_005190 [Sporomusa silvacetica DSM 10669]|uniref:Uncharacterized protein n=1 Tax=Sporomusa silvacetica DSM 10669 TaxID=1123289 RepID=A0ABZ3IFH0_9FIRM|nr:hypothetical protein SPSIL_35210 [Sporomusa silvacetica DSM 10669]